MKSYLILTNLCLFYFIIYEINKIKRAELVKKPMKLMKMF